jgi:hypothetical protein
MAAAYGFTMHRLSYYKDHPGVQEVIAVLTMDWGEQQAKAEIKRRKRMQPPSTGWAGSLIEAAQVLDAVAPAPELSRGRYQIRVPKRRELIAATLYRIRLLGTFYWSLITSVGRPAADLRDDGLRHRRPRTPVALLHRGLQAHVLDKRALVQHGRCAHGDLAGLSRMTSAMDGG